MVEAGVDEILWNAELKFEALKKYYERVEANVLFYFSDIVIQAEAIEAGVDSLSIIASPLTRVVCKSQPLSLRRSRAISMK